VPSFYERVREHHWCADGSAAALVKDFRRHAAFENRGCVTKGSLARGSAGQSVVGLSELFPQQVWNTLSKLSCDSDDVERTSRVLVGRVAEPLSQLRIVGEVGG
jgi:hypothetical protein